MTHDTMTAGRSEEVARLRWRCRRGMKELDVVLLRYLDEDFPQATPEHRDAFARILDLQDPEIFGYLVGRDTPAEASLRHVVARIRRIDA